ncbi:hypothetical protein ACGH45_07885 [Gilliamella sp. BG4]
MLTLIMTLMILSKKIKRLTELTDALYNLRQNGETRNALAQIKADQEWYEKK